MASLHCPKCLNRLNRLICAARLDSSNACEPVCITSGETFFGEVFLNDVFDQGF
jgi:hypothetical protein